MKLLFSKHTNNFLETPCSEWEIALGNSIGGIFVVEALLQLLVI